MRFLSRYLLLYAAIVLVATAGLHLANFYLPAMQTWMAIPVTLLYIATLVASIRIIERRDPYQGFFGFNYHLATYIVCIVVPLALHAMGHLEDISFLSGMALIWGIGVVVHLIIFLVVYRKRRLGSYDKKDIFQ